MLERLFVSKTRIKLLEEFLFQSDTEYHIRELARLVHDIPINVQKELKNLQSVGLLTHRKQGNMVLYKLNKDSPIVEDLKRIFLKTESIGKEILSLLYDKEKIRYALIYGSFAKGTELKSSDIDMLIIGSVNEDSILKSTQKIEKQIGRTINFILWTENEFLLKTHDNIPLIREILKTPVIMIVGDENEFKRTIKQGSS
ncbi:MAG: nucleotidyltransferase domain-containing protein [Nitrosotalea sp.]|jgi:predicted nucleotidyltransferase